MKFKLKLTTFFFLIGITSLEVLGQVAPPSIPPPPPPGLTIDGALWMLLFGGICYGIKKIKKKNSSS